MLRSFCTGCALAACLVSQLTHAALIDELATMKVALDSLCGTRFDIIFVDETKQLPPCLMSYSSHCEEIQYQGPASCDIVMRGIQDTDPSSVVNVSTY